MGSLRNAEVNGSTEKLAFRTVVSSGIQLWNEAYINWEIILFECTILGIPDSFWWRYAEFKHHPCWHSVVGGDKEDEQLYTQHSFPFASNIIKYDRKMKIELQMKVK